VQEEEEIHWARQKRACKEAKQKANVAASNSIKRINYPVVDNHGNCRNKIKTYLVISTWHSGLKDTVKNVELFFLG